MLTKAGSSHLPSRCSCCHHQAFTLCATELDKRTVCHGDKFLLLFQFQGPILCSLSYWGDPSLLHSEPSSNQQELTPGSLPLPPAQDHVHATTEPAGEAADTLFIPKTSSLAAASQTQGDGTAAVEHRLALPVGTGERSALPPEKGERKGSARGFGSSAEQLSAPRGCLFPLCVGQRWPSEEAASCCLKAVQEDS